MSESKSAGEPGAPEITHKSRAIPTVWLVPIVAAVIGVWLAVKHFTEAGVPIEVSFKTASGIEAGKTKIKYKDIQVGIVDAVDISTDLSHVKVSITMNRNGKEHLRAQTEFWVVEPRVGPGGISGLGTIISGVYINMRIGDGESTREFTGLEAPPVASGNVQGLRLVLKADGLGSLGPGEPIFFRGVRVGEIEETRLRDDGTGVDINALVEAPYDKFVRTSSHFWNVSGVEVDIDSQGLTVRTESIATILSGGLAFDSPLGQGEPARSGAVFQLYSGYREATQRPHPERGPFYVFYPPGPTRGLEVGAAVALEGVVIGAVTDVKMEYDPESGIRTPVQVRLEPENVHGVHPDDAAEVRAMIQNLVERGLRAQLKTGNLLTGALYVDLGFHPDEPAVLVGNHDLPELPAIPSALENLAHKAEQFLDHLAALPLEALVADTRGTVEALRNLIQDVDGKVDPLIDGIDGLTAAATEALGTVEAGYSPGSTLYYDLATMLEELSAAARSIRVLTAYLERHPNALITGKSKSGGRE